MEPPVASRVRAVRWAHWSSSMLSTKAQRPSPLSDDVRKVVGQTLLWADHYLTADRIAAAAAVGRDDLALYRRLVADLLDLPT
jgi:hypothetical protein